MPGLALPPPMEYSPARHCGGMSHSPPRIVTKIQPGRHVRITCGLLAGLEGIVAGEFERGRVTIECRQLAKGVLIVIDSAQLEPISDE